VVFFTCIIVLLVLYFLQQDGLIFVMMIALIAEMANLFMLKVMTKSAKQQTRKKFSKIVNSYRAKITAQKKTIQKLKDLQEDLHNANLKIKKYEQDAKDKKNPETDDTEAKKKQELKESQKSEKLRIREEKKIKIKELLNPASKPKR
jgi:hypothetical protein